jgi:SOS-response transcriptional repressor LexA
MPNAPNHNLTSTQEAALAIYRRMSDRNGEPPSVREFASALGKSHNTAHHLIVALRSKGYLTMKPTTIIRPKLTAKGRKAK